MCFKAYHETIAKLYKEVALCILQSLRGKVQWRDHRIRKLNDAQEKAEYQKQLALQQEKKDSKAAQSTEVDGSIAELVKSHPRHEYKHLLKLAEARVSNLALLSPANKTDGLDLRTPKKIIKRRAPVEIEQLSQAEIANNVLRKLIAKQKAEEENAKRPSKEFAKMLRQRFNDPSARSLKDSMAFSAVYDDQHSNTVHTPARAEKAKPDISLNQEDSPVKSIFSRSISTAMTSPTALHRASSTQRESLRKWSYIIESDSVSGKGETSGCSKAGLMNTTLRCLPSSETQLPTQSIQDVDHSGLVDISTNGVVKKYFKITQPHANQLSPSPSLKHTINK